MLIVCFQNIVLCWPSRSYSHFYGSCPKEVEAEKNEAGKGEKDGMHLTSKM